MVLHPRKQEMSLKVSIPRPSTALVDFLDLDREDGACWKASHSGKEKNAFGPTSPHFTYDRKEPEIGRDWLQVASY